jgi:hypothetical protein
LEFFAAHLSVINARLLAKLHTYQLLLRGKVFQNTFDLSDSLFSLRLSGFIFRSGNFLPDPYFYTPPNRIKKPVQYQIPNIVIFEYINVQPFNGTDGGMQKNIEYRI